MGGPSGESISPLLRILTYQSHTPGFSPDKHPLECTPTANTESLSTLGRASRSLQRARKRGHKEQNLLHNMGELKSTGTKFNGKGWNGM